MLNAVGLLTTAAAISTAARPTSECIAATSSGICVISTRLATNQPMRPPTASAPSERHIDLPVTASVTTHGDHHADDAEAVAATRRQRMRETFEREDEEDAGDEIEQGDLVRGARASSARRLLLRLLLLEHLEHALGDEEPAEGVDGDQRHGDRAEQRAEAAVPTPAARMAPTMITELMALVTLISGVCSAGVTFQTT